MVEGESQFAAEGVGFEPTIPYGMRPFQDRALGHYATPPFRVLIGNPRIRSTKSIEVF